MKKFVLALAAAAAISSPVLAQDGGTTSRLDAPSVVLNPDGFAASDMMMDESVTLGIVGSDGFSNRGDGGVNDRPYDRFGNFRF